LAFEKPYHEPRTKAEQAEANKIILACLCGIAAELVGFGFAVNFLLQLLHVSALSPSWWVVAPTLALSVVLYFISYSYLSDEMQLLHAAIAGFFIIAALVAGTIALTNRSWGFIATTIMFLCSYAFVSVIFTKDKTQDRSTCN
jgi:hypothetical protein